MFDIDAPSTTCVAKGLANAVPVTFIVSARNAIGAGAPSNETEPVIPRSSAPPSAPREVTVAPASREVVVSWLPPLEDGGLDIEGYVVTPSGRSDSPVRVSGSEHSAVVTGLENGAPVSFTVTAENSAGMSPASPPTEAVAPFGPPSVPRDVKAVPGDKLATVTWSSPRDTGGRPMTGYLVKSITHEGISVKAGPHDDHVQVAGLDNDTSYDFSVTALNTAGASDAVLCKSVVPQGTAGVVMGCMVKVACSPCPLLVPQRCALRRRPLVSQPRPPLVVPLSCGHSLSMMEAPQSRRMRSHRQMAPSRPSVWRPPSSRPPSPTLSTATPTRFVSRARTPLASAQQGPARLCSLVARQHRHSLLRRGRCPMAA